VSSPCRSRKIGSNRPILEFLSSSWILGQKLEKFLKQRPNSYKFSISKYHIFFPKCNKMKILVICCPRKSILMKHAGKGVASLTTTLNFCR
jgi:hypothetical protein